MKIDPDRYRLRAGDKAHLNKLPTRDDAFHVADAEANRLLAEHARRLNEQQQRLYASDSHALLIILQGMDTSGKDGVIAHVMSGVNPQGCEVTSFKQSSEEELDHDFLWRSVQRLPGRGRIGIFNRSYYEEVLVVRVHPELLAKEGVEGKAGTSFWEDRYRAITEFERHLHHSGTRIVKVFLHLSKKEQKERLLARIAEPAKNWKFNEADVTEREFWRDYMAAYEACLTATSAKHVPWHIVPADDKDDARLIVSAIILGALDDLDLKYPVADATRRTELATIRKALEAQD